MFQPTVPWSPSLAVSQWHTIPRPSETDPHTVGVDSAPRERESSNVRLLPGHLVPGTRFRLRRWLGEGGMGVVYEAEHVDLERPVALKILRAHVAERDDERERFRQEARMTTRIESPNVVNVLDFGLLPDGRVFYAMELLDGRPLSAEIAEGAMAPARALALLRQMCAGLAAAHRAGVIHRDIKPDNAMIVRDKSGRACVKLLDFGIASPVRTTSERRTSGTPDYMAPEQIEGRPFDGRLDMYALGCTAYEMLTGHTPFRGATTAAMLRAHLEDDPTPLTARRPELPIPKPLEEVVLRCLAKEPSDRYADMADLEAALCEAQIAAGVRTEWDDLPLPDVASDRRERIAAKMPRPMASRAKRQRRLATLLSAGAAAVVVGLWLHATTVGAADHERVDELVGAAKDAAIRGMYVYPPPGEQTDTAYRTLVTLESVEGPAAADADAAAAQLRTELATELVALGDSYWDDPDARAFARDYYAQAVLFDPQSQHARSRAGFTPGEINDLRVRAENQDFSTPELEAAEPLLALAMPDADERARKLAEVVDGDAPESATSCGRIRGLASRKRSHEPHAAAPSVQRIPVPVAVEVRTPESGIAPSQPSGRERTSARKLAKEGRAALGTGDRDEAAALFHQALALDPKNAAAAAGLSDVYFDRGEHQRALHYAQRAVQLEPKNGASLVRLGDAYFKVLDRGAARRAYERAQALGRPEASTRLHRMDTLARP
jgi:tetratricopeptide (TPR) repeat protein/predicted Ser/Thr protein kinase